MNPVLKARPIQSVYDLVEIIVVPSSKICFLSSSKSNFLFLFSKGNLAIGKDSPVKEASLVNNSPLIIATSQGSFSPSFSINLSPGTNWSLLKSLNSPSLNI